MSTDEVTSLQEVATILKKQCLIHLFLQSKSAGIYHRIHNMLSIPNILIGGVLSITIFSTSNVYWKVSTGVLAIISTILSSLSKHLSAGERAQLHCNVVRDYMSLLQDLNITLNAVDDVNEKKRIIADARMQLHRLFDCQPEPSTYAVSQFERKYKQNLEEILYEDFESIALKNATYIQNRVSLTSTQKRVSSPSASVMSGEAV